MVAPPAVDQAPPSYAAERHGDNANTTMTPQASQLVEEHLPLARRLAARYSDRGEPPEELQQVAMLGLVLAAKRFDPERGTEFAAYATPTILGEIRRHFRDHCWSVQVPRPVHDLYRQYLLVRERMTTRLQREPTTRELAAELGVEVAELSEAIDGGSAYSTMSLDRAFNDEGSIGRTLEEVTGDDDHELSVAELREAARRATNQLPSRERRILALWFYGNRTQTQIASEFGISQMHVSRIIDATLNRLRTAILQDQAGEIRWPTPRQRSAPNPDQQVA